MVDKYLVVAMLAVLAAACNAGQPARPAVVVTERVVVTEPAPDGQMLEPAEPVACDELGPNASTLFCEPAPADPNAELESRVDELEREADSAARAAEIEEAAQNAYDECMARNVPPDTNFDEPLAPDYDYYDAQCSKVATSLRNSLQGASGPE